MEAMRELGFLPEGCKKVNTPFEGPVLHTNTVASNDINRQNPNENDVPVATTLTTRPLSVIPKQIGTFVTSETHVALKSTNEPLCTLQPTTPSTLLLGMPEDDAIFVADSNPKQSFPKLLIGAPTFH
jgi:hypothetical protein